MNARIPLVAGNWKMHGVVASNAALLEGLRTSLATLDPAQVEVLLCPPFPYLQQVADALRASGLAWGAQDVSDQSVGAYTGEVSAQMLADFGCRYAIVGHSERRSFHSETDTVVANKVQRLVDAGIRPIVCVGESLAQRHAHLTDAVLAHQIDAVVGVLARSPIPVVVAYEPVWAIGTGHGATPEMAQAAHAFIRARLAAGGVAPQAVRLIYGGSVTALNARAIFAQPDVDGGLIGGASRLAADFAQICMSLS
jgi:triosephosphate isomerase